MTNKLYQDEGSGVGVRFVMTDEGLAAVTSGKFGQSIITGEPGEFWVNLNGMIITQEGGTLQIRFMYDNVEIVRLDTKARLTEGNTMTIVGANIKVPFKMEAS